MCINTARVAVCRPRSLTESLLHRQQARSENAQTAPLTSSAAFQSPEYEQFLQTGFVFTETVSYHFSDDVLLILTVLRAMWSVCSVLLISTCPFCPQPDTEPNETLCYLQAHTSISVSSDRQHLSYGDCLEVEVRGEIIRTVLCCIVY